MSKEWYQIVNMMSRPQMKVEGGGEIEGWRPYRAWWIWGILAANLRSSTPRVLQTRRPQTSMRETSANHSSSNDSTFPKTQSITMEGNTTQQLLPSPAISSPEGAYASTTDEEETLQFYQASVSSSISSLNLPARDASMSLTQRRSHRPEQHAISQVLDTDESDAEDEWDYSETEWWGWIILAVTWLVFVVVMGSCFGVWSWAWDVGETPYAPPELEDDETLPITGYYPALIVCTAIMSWVWVVVAWVGMKYFRHAKVV